MILPLIFCMVGCGGRHEDMQISDISPMVTEDSKKGVRR